jgi:hypothetical protein
LKYLHTQSERVAMPKKHDIPPRIQVRIDIACAWYYRPYHPQTGLHRSQRRRRQSRDRSCSCGWFADKVAPGCDPSPKIANGGLLASNVMTSPAAVGRELLDGAPVSSRALMADGVSLMTCSQGPG